jgi:hypothetical protein
MHIFRIIFLTFFSLILFDKSYSLNSSCLSCTSTLFRTCYNCVNMFPIDRSYLEKVHIICNSTNQILQKQERFYSVMKSYKTINCTMRTLYLDQFTSWNYLEYLSITYAHLTRLSPVIFNRSLSSLPILYSIKTLNLSHNSIRIINKNLSYYFPSLEKLDLSYNHLILIKKKTFIFFIHLKELYLNNNYLKTILPTIFPRQSLRLINLNHNHWHCSCTNVLTLSISRPIPICQTPIQFKYQNAGDIARQCFLRTKASILVSTNTHRDENLTCALSSTIDIWKNKTNKNITIESAWHIEQHRPIPLQYLYALSKKSDKYLICFNLNSSQPDSIHSIITLTAQSHLIKTTNQTMNSTTNRTLIFIKSEEKLPPLLLWFYNTSKNILPKYFQTSNKHVLIIWLILVILAFLILSFLIYLIYCQRQSKSKSISHRFLRFDKKRHEPRTALNVKFNCKNHKCLCQYRRHAHSTMYLTKSTNNLRPLLIEPSELRYARIKRISSMKTFDKDYLTGQFRTIVKLKPLPD